MKLFSTLMMMVGWYGCQLLYGCNKTGETPPAPPPVYSAPATPPSTATDTTPITFLALGDSYTIGQGVQPAERFATQTAVLLAQAGYRTTGVQYLATTGWTTQNLLTAIDNAGLRGPYQVVTVLIGVNDQYQRRDTTGYTQGFHAVLDRAVALTGNRVNRVFVLSIPDYSVTPFVPPSAKVQVSREIDLFNEINQRACSQRLISYTNITNLSREAATNKALIAVDSLHFSGLEYAKWAALLATTIKAGL